MNSRIRKIRKENEKGEIICIREINENLKRVFNNQPLTRPLRTLNKNCEFRKKYNALFDLKNEDKIKQEGKEYRKEYSQRLEVIKHRKEYRKEYWLKNKIIKKNKNENKIHKT